VIHWLNQSCGARGCFNQIDVRIGIDSTTRGDASREIPVNPRRSVAPHKPRDDAALLHQRCAGKPTSGDDFARSIVQSMLFNDEAVSAA
jgi:hypothetical protein